MFKDNRQQYQQRLLRVSDIRLRLTIRDSLRDLSAAPRSRKLRYLRTRSIRNLWIQRNTTCKSIVKDFKKFEGPWELEYDALTQITSLEQIKLSWRKSACPMHVFHGHEISQSQVARLRPCCISLGGEKATTKKARTYAALLLGKRRLSRLGNKLELDRAG
jgi:hypothetical protein